MDLGGLLVHHGKATMAGLGLAGAAPFGCSSRRELAATKGKGRGVECGSHHGLHRPGKKWREAGGGSCTTTN
jgi:hypothetical protein